jgi:hypothetical protein
LKRAVLAVAAVLAAGCAGDRPAPPVAHPPAATPKPHRAATPPRFPKRPHCPAASANCAAARGSVIYVEAVDPDGDGDAHFVLASTDSVTGPGITVIDCEKNLRPHPLPKIGDRISAAGPVYRGSYGQKQIQATVIRVARR